MKKKKCVLTFKYWVCSQYGWGESKSNKYIINKNIYVIIIRSSFLVYIDSTRIELSFLTKNKQHKKF